MICAPSVQMGGNFCYVILALELFILVRFSWSYYFVDKTVPFKTSFCNFCLYFYQSFVMHQLFFVQYQLSVTYIIFVFQMQNVYLCKSSRKVNFTVDSVKIPLKKKNLWSTTPMLLLLDALPELIQSNK